MPIISNFPSEVTTSTDTVTETIAYTSESNDVKFVDIDNNIIYSYTWDEVAALTELPDLPTCTVGTEYGFSIPMTCTGWNWSLENIQSYTGKFVRVAGVWCPTDGYTHYIMHVGSGADVSLGMTPSVDGGVSIDWGDGSDETVTSGTSNTQCAHSYDADGYYEVVIKINEGTLIIGGGASSSTQNAVGQTNTTYKTYAYHCSQLYCAYFGVNITKLNNYSFYYCMCLTSITISDGITSIGNFVFGYCYNLVNIMIPNSVTSIDTSAFPSCSNLTSLIIPDSVTSFGTSIFTSCYNLESFVIPDGVTSISTSILNSCYTLKNISIPNGVTKINENAFYNCYALRSVTIPDSVTNIGVRAFSRCYALMNVVIPDNVTIINNYAFYSCYNLEDITISDNVTTIGSYGLSCCYNLTYVAIPSNLTSIGDYAFYGCFSLTTITGIYIADDDTATNMFTHCIQLMTVTARYIGASVSFSDSELLTVDSLNSIIGALADYSSDSDEDDTTDTSTSYTLTIGSTNLAKLTDDEIAVATNKGWTVS